MHGKRRVGTVAACVAVAVLYTFLAEAPKAHAASTPADIAVKFSAPYGTAPGFTFTETVVVTNKGPSNASGVATNLFIPAGLTVTPPPAPPPPPAPSTGSTTL